MEIQLINLPKHGDERGSLIALEKSETIPFEIKRVYYIFDTKPGVRRGFHAHKDLQQVAIAVKGSCKFLLDDGKQQAHVELSRPDQGLFVDKMIWHEMYDFSEDCVLMVLASDYYDEEDYIRFFADFKKAIVKC